MQDGPCNDVWPMSCHRMPHLLGQGRGFVVETGRDLDSAIVAAEQHTESFCLI